MTERDSNSRVSEFDADAIAFVREELDTAAEGFYGPLARLLRAHSLANPFVVLPPGSGAAGLARGGPRGSGIELGADAQLAAGIHRWLSQSADGLVRLLVLEEPLSRRTDPALATTDRSIAFFQDRVYKAAVNDDDELAVLATLGWPFGYPGIGALAVVCPETCQHARSGELHERDLRDIAAGTVAVLVRAWDDEATLVAPVSDRLEPADLVVPEPRTIYDILREPDDSCYRELLEHAASLVATGLLAMRGPNEVTHGAHEILAELAPWTIEQVDVADWPGTRRFGGVPARLHRFRFGREAARILIRQTNSLYEWAAPKRPQDLCLFRDDGSVWLCSVAHERDGYLELTRADHDVLKQAVPNLALGHHGHSKRPG